jgi:hypothetical protein
LFQKNGCCILTNTNQLLCCGAQRNLYLYNNSNGSWILNKTISFEYPQDITQNQYVQENILITPDNSRVILMTSERSGDSRKNSTLRVAVINIDDILNANDGDVINPTQYSNLVFNEHNYTTSNNIFEIVTNSDGTIIFVYNNSSIAHLASVSAGFGYALYYNAQLWTLSVENSQQLLGIRYKNQFFRNTNSQLLSATASDVASGKTFIGYDGTVQTGTLETTTEENSEETTT